MVIFLLNDMSDNFNKKLQMAKFRPKMDPTKVKKMKNFFFSTIIFILYQIFGETYPEWDRQLDEHLVLLHEFAKNLYDKVFIESSKVSPNVTPTLYYQSHPL